MSLGRLNHRETDREHETPTAPDDSTTKGA
jgi:hypothetical protein